MSFTSIFFSNQEVTYSFKNIFKCFFLYDLKGLILVLQKFLLGNDDSGKGIIIWYDSDNIYIYIYASIIQMIQ